MTEKQECRDGCPRAITISERRFFAELVRTRRGWRLADYRIRRPLRTRGVRHCPVSAVSARLGVRREDEHNFRLTVWRDGTDVTRRIVRASDHPVSNLDPDAAKPRRRLLDACGLDRSDRARVVAQTQCVRR